MLLQHFAGEHRHLSHLRPRDSRDGIEIDAQLVRMLEIVGAHRVRVQIDAAEVDHPGELRRIVHHQLDRATARGKAQLDRVDPDGSLHGRALLEEELSLRAIDEPLHRHRAPAHAPHRALRDRQVIEDQVALRVPRLGEEHLLRIGDGHLASGDLEHVLLGRHGGTLPESHAARQVSTIAAC